MKKVISIVLALAMMSFVCVFFAGAVDVTTADPVDPVALSETGVADIVVDGIGYDLYTIDERMARIVNATNATGDFEIPLYVQYDGKTYKVVAIVGGAFTDCVGLKTITLPDFDGFTIVNLANGVDIVNGVFVNCKDADGNDATVKIYYRLEQAAITAYCALTSDNVDCFMTDIDKDIDEGVFSIITKIWKYILEFFKKLFKIG